jgi:hypothetical protein
MALEWHFGRIQWQLFRRKSLGFPCIFRCYREFARERFARDWILRHTYPIVNKPFIDDHNFRVSFLCRRIGTPPVVLYNCGS